MSVQGIAVTAAYTRNAGTSRHPHAGGNAEVNIKALEDVDFLRSLSAGICSAFLSQTCLLLTLKIPSVRRTFLPILSTLSAQEFFRVREGRVQFPALHQGIQICTSWFSRPSGNCPRLVIVGVFSAFSVEILSIK